ncbi:type II toxin-antitoxin system HipA family toxin [soil metagenome]
MSGLEVRLSTAHTQLTIGRVGQRDGELLLELTEEYREAALDLSPIRLPKATTPRLLRWSLRHPFGPLPGLLDDTMPDAWGQKVMDRHLAAAGISASTIIQRLAWLGSTTMGAITYHPADRDFGDPVAVDLAAAAHASTELISGQPEEVLEVIARAGGSPGGARPKLLVGIGPHGHLLTGEGDLPGGYTPHLVKFNAPGDSIHAAALEHAYLQMAKRAGITVPDSQLLTDGTGRRHLVVTRFDRATADGGFVRIHSATASGLLHASHLLPSSDYETLLRLTRRLTGDIRHVEQQLRRAMFNVMAHNRDDHTKNHGFILDGHGDWSIAPAYDLTHSAGAGGEHALTVNGKGRDISRADLMALGASSGLSDNAVVLAWDAVHTALSSWMELAAGAGVPERAAHHIKATHLI